MVQQFLLMAARDNPLISIIERGDSYRPLVELMGGRMITMSLDTDQTINPWDLPEGDKEPSKDQVAFLKNSARHMLGEGRAEDRASRQPDHRSDLADLQASGDTALRSDSHILRSSRPACTVAG